MKKRIEVNNGIHPLHFFKGESGGGSGGGRVNIFDKYLLGGVKKFILLGGGGVVLLWGG